MKNITLHPYILSLLLLAASANAATPQVSTEQNSSYAVTARGPNHRVWERIENEQTPLGTPSPKVHRYSEVATGMHYLENGEWKESQDEIEVVPGGAAARKGQHQVIFANNLATVGAIDQLTPDGKRLRSHIIGLSYYDPTTDKAVLIAEVKECVGQLISRNQVLYADAFTDFKVDVRYTYKKASFEQDVILRERPPNPEEFGLNAATTRLEVLTEFIDAPQPAQTEHPLKSASGLSLPNQKLDFGGMKMGSGKAFILGDERRLGGVPVGKQWLRLENRNFLVEEVAMADMQTQLQTLPAVAMAVPNAT